MTSRPWWNRQAKLVRSALLCAYLLTLSTPVTEAQEDPRLSALEPVSLIQSILEHDQRLAKLREKHRIQVVLGVVEDDDAGKPQLVQQGYGDESLYFYPASTIKLCAAIAALEQLSELAQATELPIDVATRLIFHPLFDGEAIEDHDPSNRVSGHLTIEHEIRKLFLVSDNIAFNHLYEFVGPSAINRSMRRAGLSSARIVHRLSERRTAAENLRLPRIDLLGKTFRHVIPERTDRALEAPRAIAGIRVGKAFLRDGQRIDESFDFTDKNRMSLRDLQRALAKVVRPEANSGGESFRLTPAHRSLLLEAMRQLPRESTNPVYDAKTYPDNYVKFFLPGLQRLASTESRAVQRFEIYNKIGQAYGFSIENSYIVDPTHDRAFFLAAVIYTNKDGVLNDDAYEYEEVAEPFFADLVETVARNLWQKSTPTTKPPSVID